MAAKSKPARKHTGRDGTPLKPWSIAELNRLFASARTGCWIGEAPAGVDSRLWWPAFIAAILDTGATTGAVLHCNRASYNRDRGTLACDVGPGRGWTVHELHPLAIEFLERLVKALPADESRLFPWRSDSGQVGTMLFREYRAVLFRGQLPQASSCLFGRLARTADGWPGRVLDDVDPTGAEAVLRLGRPQFARAGRDRGAEYAETNRRRRPRNVDPPLVAIADPRTDRTLREFFLQRFVPRRLSSKQQRTAGEYLRAIDRLCAYAACEVTVEQLNDDLLERFLAWEGERVAPATVNSRRAYLLSLWRFAYAKDKSRVLVAEPRDVPKARVSKRMPQCWSEAELGRIFDAAARQPGFVGAVPAATWWPALLGALYDTGLRIDALMSLRVQDLDTATGWLLVPAAIQKQDADQAFKLHADTLAAIAAIHDRERAAGEASNRTPPQTGDGPQPHVLPLRGGPPAPEGEATLFPWPFDPTRDTSKARWITLRRRYRKILIRAGVAHGEHDLFHKIRRTSATFLADATGDAREAQRHLGHSSPQVTARYIDPRKLRKGTIAADLIPRPTIPRAGAAG